MTRCRRVPHICVCVSVCIFMSVFKWHTCVMCFVLFNTNLQLKITLARIAILLMHLPALPQIHVTEWHHYHAVDKGNKSVIHLATIYLLPFSPNFEGLVNYPNAFISFAGS